MAKRVQKQASRQGESYYRRDAGLSSSQDTGYHRPKVNTDQAVSDANQTISDIDKSLSQHEVSQRPSSAEQSEINSMADQPFYKSTDKHKATGKSWLRRNGKALSIGGAIATLVTSGVLFFAKPLEIVSWAKLLEQFHFSGMEEVSDQRVGRALHNWRWKNARPEGRLNIVTRKWAEKIDGQYDRRTGKLIKPGRLETEFGIRGVVDANGRGIGYEITDVEKARAHLDFDDFKRNNIRFDLKEGGIIDASQSFFGKEGRFLNRSLLSSLGYNKLAAHIMSRPLNLRFGWTFHPLGRVARLKNESTADYLRRLRNEFRRQIKQGDYGFEAKNRKQAGEKASDEEKKAAETRDKIAKDANDMFGDSSKYGNERLADIKAKITTAINGKIGIIGAATAVVCVIRAIGEVADQLDFQQIMLPLMRLGGRTVTTGHQLMSSEDVNATELGAEAKRYYDPVAKKNFGDAYSVQYEMGKKLTGDPEVGKKLAPGAHKNFVNDKIGGIPGLGPVCTFVGSTLGGLLIDVADVGIDIFSLGAGFLVGLGIGKALGPAFNWIAEVIAGEEVNVDAQGAVFGEYANYGARLAANEEALTMGGKQLSTTEEQGLKDYTRTATREEFASHNLWYRLFNREDPGSILAQASLALPHSPAQAMATLHLDTMGTFLNGFSGWLGKLVPQLKAIDNFDYNGYPKVGFDVNEINNSEFENPLQNADVIEPKLFKVWFDEEGNPHPPLTSVDKYNKCFGVTLHEDGRITFRHTQPSPLPSECAAQDTLFVRYRFYLADLLSNMSLACYEDDREACTTLGLPEDETATASPTDSGTVSGSVQELSKQILNSPSITYPFVDSAGGTARDVLVALADGRPAFTRVTTSCATPPSNSTTDVNPNILKFLLEAGRETHVAVNALTNGCHSNNSLHYSGEAVDLNLSSGPLSVLDPIAHKYGGSKNSETTHHHYDFPR